MFFFSSRRRHTRCLSDWSSDVCSSDLLTTHYVEEAEPCDRVAVLDRGHLVAQGTPAELKRAAGAGSLEEAFLARTGRPLAVADAAAVQTGPERARWRATGGAMLTECLAGPCHRG